MSRIKFDLHAAFEATRPRLAGKTRLPLLKEIERVTADVFLEHLAPQAEEGAMRAKVENAALQQNFQDVADFSEDFYTLLSFSSDRQQLAREWTVRAMAELPHGFSPFESCLIAFAARVSGHYDHFYRAWIRAVQGNATAERLLRQPPPPGSRLFNHYTIIQQAKQEDNKTKSEQGGYTHAPYATVFREELQPILKTFDAWVFALDQVAAYPEERSYVKFIDCYRQCLGEEDENLLEEKWRELDILWMEIRHPIQIVHDMEYGYGDPLRCKVIPDFSLRLLDETYDKANKTIDVIQGHMVNWFQQRDADLARRGLTALKSSMAGLYYIPFQCGMSLHFRFSGQSIPNRSEVRDLRGVKIFFDPISTGARQVQTKSLIPKVFHNADHLCAKLDPVATLIYHVAAHEIGHAIYGLDYVSDVIKTDTKTLLEEPRAELTSLHTMLLLYRSGMLTLEGLQEHLASFAVQDLRRFAMFRHSATRPYTISAINGFKTYVKHGYVVRQEDGLLKFDDSKAVETLEDFSQQFVAILDAEDARDGARLEQILQSMQSETLDIVGWLVSRLYNSTSDS